MSSTSHPNSLPIRLRSVAPRAEEDHAAATTAAPTRADVATEVALQLTGAGATMPPPGIIPPDDFRTMIRPADCGKELAIEWPMRKKWMTLSIIFLVQVSMNLNTTLYSNGSEGIAFEYNISQFGVRWGGAASFLIAYAFGCELWAPWSEEYGRWWVLQASLFLVNCWAVLVATAPSWSAHVAGRILGGLSSAGGSVTLALITDMFRIDDPMFQYATSFIVLSSVGGSIIGPIIGGFIEEYMVWRWCIWFQVIFGVIVQVLHLVFVKETRGTVVMDRVAKERRKSGQNPHLFGPNEMSGKGRLSWAEVGQIWMRPFTMLLTEPIVLAFSLLSGFSDALIFMMVQSFSFVYWQWGFDHIQLGLAFIPIGVGYLICFGIFFLSIRRNVNLREKNPESEYAQYESRLWVLLFLGALLPIGLLVFAFTSAWSSAPMHWIFSMLGSCLIGIANFAIYMATIDYVLRAYGPYAASATGGNGWARDFLAGILTPYAIPMYERLSIFLATILLFALAAVLYGAVLVVYYKGPWLRRRSKFAQTLAHAAADQQDNATMSEVNSSAINNNVNGLLHFLSSQDLPGSRAASSAGSTPIHSPINSPRTSLQTVRPPMPRQPSETSEQRPRMGQRQISHLSAGRSPLHEITTAASGSGNSGGGGGDNCGCDVEAASRCNCNKNTPETERSSGPTSVREVEDTQRASAALQNPRQHEANEGLPQEREKVADNRNRKQQCIVV